MYDENERRRSARLHRDFVRAEEKGQAILRETIKSLTTRPDSGGSAHANSGHGKPMPWWGCVAILALVGYICTQEDTQKAETNPALSEAVPVYRGKAPPVMNVDYVALGYVTPDKKRGTLGPFNCIASGHGVKLTYTPPGTKEPLGSYNHPVTGVPYDLESVAMGAKDCNVGFKHMQSYGLLQ